MSRYFRVLYGQEDFAWVDSNFVINYVNKEGKRCGYDGFDIPPDEVEAFGLQNAFCPDEESNFYVSGQWSNANPFYYRFQVKTCNAISENPEEECEAEEEIKKHADEVLLDYFFQNYYFDTEDFTGNPIKPFT